MNEGSLVENQKLKMLNFEAHIMYQVNFRSRHNRSHFVNNCISYHLNVNSMIYLVFNSSKKFLKEGSPDENQKLKCLTLKLMKSLKLVFNQDTIDLIL